MSDVNKCNLKCGSSWLRRLKIGGRCGRQLRQSNPRGGEEEKERAVQAAIVMSP